jgi:hypothetical protein
MVTWQMRSSLGSHRVISVTAFGRLSSFPLLPLTGPPSLLASSLARLGRLDRGAMLNFAFTEFSEVRLTHPKRLLPTTQQKILHLSDAQPLPLWCHGGRRNIKHKVEALNPALRKLGTQEGLVS